MDSGVDKKLRSVVGIILVVLICLGLVACSPAKKSESLQAPSAQASLDLPEGSQQTSSQAEPSISENDLKPVAPESVAPAQGAHIDFELYLVASGGKLYTEAASLPGNRLEVNEIVQQLLSLSADKSCIATGTKLVSLQLADMVCCVNLSKEFLATSAECQKLACAQIVLTLTQFSDVEAVEFQVEGQALPEDFAGGINGPQPRQWWELMLNS